MACTMFMPYLFGPTFHGPFGFWVITRLLRLFHGYNNLTVAISSVICKSNLWVPAPLLELHPAPLEQVHFNAAGPVPRQFARAGAGHARRGAQPRQRTQTAQTRKVPLICACAHDRAKQPRAYIFPPPSHSHVENCGSIISHTV